ncbi:hypothetical protein COY65_00840 [Candidatus Jorgensenbacteria bacterium CG_4_10_14_0_8_um_filter_39_13]|uniref:Uncharacterized protein n=2 Tax=Candidatus Joergenseniibacteriota TaxID=1752739 RepID=A0A2M7RJ75_9BACT|nr:MAG: hypothetical protein COV54_02235 [Candidatus Jorgensenbacteria bacterium CG11_big_fil_rev_8_21_14_0_20_38_23]PIV13348.1 MAG: hypothetical protein COS46_00710 [Candidatus Jorgensenbacteria bacterium CG03_land_8_20_14_0_80_38_39]PIW97381.1 MAG: hypothetical protein COZ81_03015 [Candidatus Jorgensenbacteria bacterium CG_4_8_14_3_um_filter_38_10]PIY96426.1 MAG: hypothetical protein COY65_00840 [Candidatus Jorgensenbacteria bacterium CG_4_10_14_0_8_um_filter_39_13]PJA95080.1 MAG: hypothetica
MIPFKPIPIVQDYKNKIFAVLKRLKNEGLISSYEFLVGNQPASLFFKLIIRRTGQPLYQKFDISYGVKNLQSSSRFTRIDLPQSPFSVNIVSEMDLERTIRGEISKRILGFMNEEKALEAMKSLVQTGELQDCFRAPSYSDIHRGADIYGTFFSEENEFFFKMGVSIKSSLAGRERHKKKYPQAPSLVITKEMKIEDITKKLLEIKEAFMRGEIIHV